MESAHITSLVETARDEYHSLIMLRRSGVGLPRRHNRAQRTLIILVDFRKVFATVEHSTLVKLLMRLPARLLIHWLRNLPVHRDARVKLGNRLSPRYGLEAGVPQGTVLGPQLFSMYIASPLGLLVDKHPDVQLDMCADDLAISILRRARDEGVGIGNNILVDVVPHGAIQTNGMKVGPPKCEAALLCTLPSHTGEDRVSRSLLHGSACSSDLAIRRRKNEPSASRPATRHTRANFNNNANAIQNQTRRRDGGRGAAKLLGKSQMRTLTAAHEATCPRRR
ncbi:hypothetical protein JKF63_05300 [Porcisia hertigi]|uniref:Reverse transcriptase domain-containing protein n=1 Tax=Porcisia hertigi TaxID=2761500 RepID=A0A836ICJ2_9TRYP|nr:hypothetical protein JKF63_05300 [Porcisia hertigi]